MSLPLLRGFLGFVHSCCSNGTLRLTIRIGVVNKRHDYHFSRCDWCLPSCHCDCSYSFARHTHLLGRMNIQPDWVKSQCYPTLVRGITETSARMSQSFVWNDFRGVSERAQSDQSRGYLMCLRGCVRKCTRSRWRRCAWAMQPLLNDLTSALRQWALTFKHSMWSP